jgi:hypothetical protein
VQIRYGSSRARLARVTISQPFDVTRGERNRESVEAVVELGKRTRADQRGDTALLRQNISERYLNRVFAELAPECDRPVPRAKLASEYQERARSESSILPRPARSVKKPRAWLDQAKLVTPFSSSQRIQVSSEDEMQPAQTGWTI